MIGGAGSSGVDHTVPQLSLMIAPSGSALHRRIAGAGLVVLCSLLPTVIRAQLASGPFGSGVVSGWRLTTAAGGGWDQNVQFLDGVGINATSLNARAEGARLWQGRRNRVEAVLGGGLVRFPQNSALDQRSFNVLANVDRTFSELTSGQFQAGYASSFLNRSLIGVGTGLGTQPGVLLPRFIQARTSSVSGRLERRLSRQLIARFSASGQQSSTEAEGFPDGRFAALSAELAKQLSVETTVGVAAEYQYSKFGEITANLPIARVNVLHVLASGLTARAFAGVALGTGFEASVPNRLFGGASLGMRRNWGELAADVQRAVGQQFGLESSSILVTNSAALGYTRLMTRKLTLAANASYGSTSDPTGQTFTSAKFAEFTTSARYTIPNGPAFSLVGFVRQREDLESIRSYGGTLTVDYTWSQLRRRTGAQNP